MLLRHVLGCDRATLYARWETVLADAAWERYQHLLGVRASGRPIHYIVGEREFMGLRFRVDERVMIPRPETEVLVEFLIEVFRARPAVTLVDVGTGSGCIAVNLAHFLPSARVYAVDISADALEVARANTVRHSVHHRVTFLEGDLLRPLPAALLGQVDAIASNPPYVPRGHARALSKEIRDFEPALAIFASGDGTEIHHRLISGSSTWLTPTGLLVLEVALGQAEAVANAMRRNERYIGVRILKDLAGVDRVVVGTLARPEGRRT